MKKPSRLIAVGDIHGCFRALKELIEEVIIVQISDMLVFVGDYIDRGNESKEVVDFIMGLRSKGYHIVTLMGNHEAMLLDAYKNSEDLPVWLFNGGGATLNSFGLGSVFDLPGIYLDFFKNLQFYYMYEHFIFVHGGFNDQVRNPFEDTFYMLWSRNEYYSNPVFYNKIIIHGHTPIPIEACKLNIEKGSRIINIDTGCVYRNSPGNGILTAVDLLTKEIYSVSCEEF